MSDAGSSTDALASGSGAGSSAAQHEPDAQQQGQATAAAAAPTEFSASEALLEKIERLKKEQQEARQRKKQLTKDLKNAEKRRARLRKRARQLSDVDLRELLRMRQTPAEEEGAPAGEEQPAASSSATSPAGAGDNS